jgi:hypothetical protein
MSGPTTIEDGELVRMDPADISVFSFDWDTRFLTLGVAIASSSFTVTPILAASPAGTLADDSASILAGNRSTQIRLDATGAVLGEKYEIANQIVTNESPAQTKERSFFVLVEDQ